MRVSKNSTLAVICFVLFLSNYGCSVHSAAKQPDEKNISLLNTGTPRAKLLAEYGSPIHTETKNGVKSDIFSFVQGYSTATKTGRAFFHGAADVMTLGLWELVGGSVEGAYNGEKMSFQVNYDKNDNVQTVQALNEESTKEISSVDSSPKGASTSNN